MPKFLQDGPVEGGDSYGKFGFKAFFQAFDDGQTRIGSSGKVQAAVL